MTYNPKIKNISSTKIQVEADIDAYNINLGKPEDLEPNDDGITEDPTYQDGLFKDFTEDFTVGYAIDRINEVLGKLAPSPAPKLDSLNSSADPGESQLLAEGASDAIVGLLERNTGDSRKLSAVDSNSGLFSVKSDGNVGGTKYQRLGIFSQAKSLTFYLNGTESEDLQGTEVNYPNFAYNTTATNPAEPDIEVWINGEKIDLVTNINVTVDTDPTNQPATFASGKTFNGFLHSVTNIVVDDSNLWREGHNYIQAKYVLPDETIDTSYADWFYAPEERTGAPLTFSSGEAQVTIDTGDTKYISGIKYYSSPTQFTVKPPANGQITNYAIHCYPQNYGVSANEIGATSGKDASETNFLANTDLDFTNNTLDISKFNTRLLNNRRLNNQKIKLSMQVNNNLGRSASKIYESNDLYMFDSFNDDDGTFAYNGGTQSTVLDDFNHEGHRVDSSNSDTWNPETGDPASIVAWDSTAVLADGDAALHNSKLYHPQFLSTLGNISNPTQDSSLPDFANFTSPAYYYRKLKKNTDANNTMKFTIECSNGVVFGTSEEDGKWSIEVQNKTGTWLDVCKSKDVSGGAGIGTLLNDPVSPPTGTSRTLEVQWAANRGGGPLNDDVWLMRIKAPAGTADNYIEKITITFA